MATLGNHDIVIVSVSNTQDVSCNAIASQRSCKILNSLIELVIQWILFFQPFSQRSLLQGTSDHTLFLLNRSSCNGMRNYFNKSFYKVSGGTGIGSEVEIKACLLPKSVHEPEHLKSQHVSS